MLNIESPESETGFHYHVDLADIESKRQASSYLLDPFVIAWTSDGSPLVLHILTHMDSDSNAIVQLRAIIALNEEIHKAAPMHLQPPGEERMEAAEISAPQMRCRIG